MLVPNIIADTIIEIVVAIFLLILIFLISIILIILTLKINIKLYNFEYDSKKNKEISKSSKFKFSIFAFGIIKIFRFSERTVKRLNKSKKFKKIEKKVAKKIKENKKNIKLKNIFFAIKSIAKIDVKMNKLNLKIQIGTENVVVTSYITAFISSVIGIILRKNLNMKSKFVVIPIYINKNVFKLDIDADIDINIGKLVRKIIFLMILKQMRKFQKKIKSFFVPTKIEKLRKRTCQIKYKLQKKVNTN